MTEKNEDNVKHVIEDAAAKKHLEVRNEDVDALSKAYMKHGDIDLAVNAEGDVISDIMDGEELDVIADALTDKFEGEPETEDANIIVVTFNGKSYDTYIDEHGTQRFVGNPVVRKFMSVSQKRWVNYFTGSVFDGGADYDRNEDHPDEPVNMGTLSAMFREGEFTQEEWLDFHALLGYSVDLLVKMLDDFSNMEYENPLQDDK